MSEVIFVETMEQARQAWREFAASDGMLAFDTETTGLYVRAGEHGDKGRTVQISFRPWDVAYVFEMTDRWREPIAAFFEAAQGVIAHNLKFDVHVMETYGVKVFDLVPNEGLHDTVWVARLHDERDGARLKPLAVTYLSDDSADEQSSLKRLMRKNNWDWATVPVRYLVEYGGLDAILTGRLFDLLRPRIDYAYDAYRREQKLAPIVYRMEREGLLVDQELLEHVDSTFEKEIEETKAAIEERVPGLNPNAAHQIKAALRDLDVEVADTSAATLMALSEPDDAVALASLVLRYRAAKKAHSTYTQTWRKLITPEGRIHPNLNTLGAKTGRFSSSDPNLQNVKRGHTLRDVFIAPEGSKMVVADWDQMELRLYAHFARDERMRAAFLAGEDVYQQAADLMGVSRQIGKMIMLASIYGAGPKTLKTNCVKQAYQFGFPEVVPELLSFDWVELHRKFHAAYRIKDLARLTELQARRRGQLGEAYIVTLGGRRQRPKRVVLPPYNSHGSRQTIYIYKDLGNSLVQGSSSDLMKQAIIDADEAGLGEYMRLTVHDELILEVPDDKVEWASEIMEKVMTRREFVPPLTVGAQAAQRYGEAK